MRYVHVTHAPRERESYIYIYICICIYTFVDVQVDYMGIHVIHACFICALAQCFAPAGTPLSFHTPGSIRLIPNELLGSSWEFLNIKVPF